ncbi:solute carrier family 23 protein [Alteribacillus iranensis]|uniref:Permease family protein n=1 Tax=Alteribacillus iranensis TaxID=930128 RepID=A0A1I2FGL9_9BACI|nr:solute carrier family 23 protein [Alteribacillus iranensis]SFF04405.1 Permease family protein [Alteribacillus iranensis]
MSFYKRREGGEQPYWPFGPFKLRVPFVHYNVEGAEAVQAVVLSVVTISMIPLLQQHLGLPYDVAMAFVIICGICNMIPAFLGTPFIPGWITPAVPLVVIFLGDFEPGPEAIQALVAVQLLVFFIFFILGITKLGSKIVSVIPNSLKAGVVIGAGLAALIGEIGPEGTLGSSPISFIIGGLLTVYFMFSLSFKNLRQKSKIAETISNYGMVPAFIVAIIIGIAVSEYPMPDVEWGIVSPAFGEMWAYLPFSVGFPTLEMFMMAVPTAIIAYIIAYGDIIVGDTLIERVNDIRKDEEIENSIDRVHLITSVRNFIHALFAPYPGLAGPIWTAATATVIERYTFGRKAMDSVYGGAGTFHIANFMALFLLPLVTFFQPVLPIGLSLTLLVTGYLCVQVGMEQVHTNTERGIAGVTAAVLAIHGAAYGLITGIVLYILIEKVSKKSQEDTHSDNLEKKKIG